MECERASRDAHDRQHKSGRRASDPCIVMRTVSDYRYLISEVSAEFSQREVDAASAVGAIAYRHRAGKRLLQSEQVVKRADSRQCRGRSRFGSWRGLRHRPLRRLRAGHRLRLGLAGCSRGRFRGSHRRGLGADGCRKCRRGKWLAREVCKCEREYAHANNNGACLSANCFPKARFGHIAHIIRECSRINAQVCDVCG